mmetsp:Transcript_60316/g.141115  ORF Transcript_60316/g.141115 Transcript_60316/m.141115 type:complete len:110 (+) Transcript_60316:2117-2446(+)
MKGTPGLLIDQTWLSLERDRSPDSCGHVSHKSTAAVHCAVRGLNLRSLHRAKFCGRKLHFAADVCLSDTDTFRAMPPAFTINYSLKDKHGQLHGLPGLFVVDSLSLRCA